MHQAGQALVGGAFAQEAALSEVGSWSEAEQVQTQPFGGRPGPEDYTQPAPSWRALLTKAEASYLVAEASRTARIGGRKLLLATQLSDYLHGLAVLSSTHLYLLSPRVPKPPWGGILTSQGLKDIARFQDHSSEGHSVDDL